MSALVPPLVSRAEALAARLPFGRSSSREVGRLLHLLAAQRGRARVGEIGTGCGVGLAHPDLAAAELTVSPQMAVIGAVRMR